MSNKTQVMKFFETFGRLAQLAEHLVYTERVGGSIPSPPTTISPMGGSYVRECRLRLFDASSRQIPHPPSPLRFRSAALVFAASLMAFTSARAEEMNFRVIGVMESKGGGPGGNLDKSIFLPLTTAQDRLFKQKNPNGEYKVSVIYASIDDANNIPLVQEEITQLMRERRGIQYLDQDDFSIISQNDLIAVFGDILGALTIFLGAIAAISLLVGGIGIMNIMLVSVTERTREIGLRKAVGARRSDVLIQFLIEAMALAIVGGMIGVALGWGLARLVSVLFGEFQAVVGADAVITSLVVATAVGLFFGIFPAYRASRLNPIDALRYE